MMQPTPITVAYTLEEVLTRLEAKIDKLDENIDKVNEKVDKQALEIAELKTLREDIKEIKGSLTRQIWTLIGILITVATGFILAVGRYVFSGNP